MIADSKRVAAAETRKITPGSLAGAALRIGACHDVARAEMTRARGALVLVAAVVAAAAVAILVRSPGANVSEEAGSSEPPHVTEASRASRADDIDAAPGESSSDVVRRRLEIEASIARDVPSTRLRKAELRPAMKRIIPLLQHCYERELARAPQIRGVINTKLTIRNEPALGMMLSVNGFDTHGELGESREFLACVTKTFESTVYPPIATRGALDLTYPSTFATESPGDRDKPIVDKAERDATNGRWSEALDDAEQGLTLTSLDGPLRRRLIEVAGLSACHLKDQAKAQHYYSLASPEFEERLQETCLQFASLDLLK